MTTTRKVEAFDNAVVVVENFIEIGRFPINADVTKDEALRHAEMFIAAGDLLAALEEIIDYNGGAPSALDDEYVMDRARTAIARARGETV